MTPEENIKNILKETDHEENQEIYLEKRKKRRQIMKTIMIFSALSLLFLSLTLLFKEFLG